MWRELIKRASINRGFFPSSRIRNPSAVWPSLEWIASSQAWQRVNKHLFSHAPTQAHIPTLHNCIAAFRCFHISILPATTDLIEKESCKWYKHELSYQSFRHSDDSLFASDAVYIYISWYRQFGEIFCFHFQEITQTDAEVFRRRTRSIIYTSHKDCGRSEPVEGGNRNIGYVSTNTIEPFLPQNTSVFTWKSFRHLWRWRQHVFPKFRCQPKNLHGFKTHKAFIFTHRATKAYRVKRNANLRLRFHFLKGGSGKQICRTSIQL